jgi:hypothetical protein
MGQQLFLFQPQQGLCEPIETYNNHFSGKSSEGKETFAKNEEAQRW